MNEHSITIPDPSEINLKRSPAWWDQWFLTMAGHVSTASKDPSTKVGAVIVDDKSRIVSLGFNGFPRGVRDSPERLNNRDLKYKIVVHAEANCLIFAKENLEGCTIYTWPFLPCSVCMGLIIQAGIKRVVTYANDNPRWQDSFIISRMIAKEANVKIMEYLNTPVVHAEAGVKNETQTPHNT